MVNKTMQLINITTDIEFESGVGVMFFVALFTIVSLSAKCCGPCCDSLKRHYRLRRLNTLQQTLMSTSSAICSICLDDYSDAENKITKLECGHIYHKECVKDWLENNSTCPVCRTEIM